jgi:hypothetical protein
MQEGVPTLDTECADDQIDRLPDRHTVRAKAPVVRGRTPGNFYIKHFREGKAPQSSFDDSGILIGVYSLKNLT